MKTFLKILNMIFATALAALTSILFIINGATMTVKVIGVLAVLLCVVLFANSPQKESFAKRTAVSTIYGLLLFITTKFMIEGIHLDKTFPVMFKITLAVLVVVFIISIISLFVDKETNVKPSANKGYSEEDDIEPQTTQPRDIKIDDKPEENEGKTITVGSDEKHETSEKTENDDEILDDLDEDFSDEDDDLI